MAGPTTQPVADQDPGAYQGAEFQPEPGTYDADAYQGAQDVGALPATPPLPGGPEQTLQQGQDQQAFAQQSADQQTGNYPSDIDRVNMPPPPPSPDAPEVAPQPEPVIVPTVKASDIIAEGQNIRHDLATGQIKPETFNSMYAKKDTQGKIGTLFGLLVGSMGAGLSKQPGLIIDMMDKEVQRDFDAQKENAKNAQNFVSLQQKQQVTDGQLKKWVSEGRLSDAQADHWKLQDKIARDAAARVAFNEAALQSLIAKRDSYPEGSPERLKLDAALALAVHEGDKKNMSIAQLAQAQSGVASAIYGNIIDPGAPSTSGGASGSMEAPGTPGRTSPNDEKRVQTGNTLLRALGKGDLAKGFSDHRIPGVKGNASRPVSDASHKEILAGHEFENQLAGFINWVKTNGGSTDVATRSEGYGKAVMLKDAYRAASNGGTFSPSEAEFISALIPKDPAQFFPETRTLKPLMALQKEQRHRMDGLYKSFGYPGAPAAEPSWEAPKKNETPQSKSGRKMIKDPKSKSGWSYEKEDGKK